MGMKTRLKSLYDQRNGLPIKALGDKIYKHPDYTPGFFKEGGLVAGSSKFLSIMSTIIATYIKDVKGEHLLTWSLIQDKGPPDGFFD